MEGIKQMSKYGLLAVVSNIYNVQNKGRLKKVLKYGL